jgi:K+-sensing histidine kinase KdpD
MRKLPWREISGPVLTILVSLGTLYVHRHIVHTVTPGALPFMAVLYSAYVGGIVPGLISATIAIMFAAVVNSLDNQFLTYNLEGWVRLGAMVACVILFTLLIGTLRSRATRLLETERASRKRVEKTNTELMRLHASLNRVNYGIVLLDEELNAQNRSNPESDSQICCAMYAKPRWSRRRATKSNNISPSAWRRCGRK